MSDSKLSRWEAKIAHRPEYKKFFSKRIYKNERWNNYNFTIGPVRFEIWKRV